MAAFECGLLRVEDGGTHSIVTGLVTHVVTDPSRLALMYCGGAFGLVARDGPIA